MSEARMNDPQYIKDSFQKVGADLTEKQVKQFYRYYELLTEWNQVMNLTAITEYEEVILKHCIDTSSGYDKTKNNHRRRNRGGLSRNSSENSLPSVKGNAIGFLK